MANRILIILLPFPFVKHFLGKFVKNFGFPLPLAKLPGMWYIKYNQ